MFLETLHAPHGTDATSASASCFGVWFQACRVPAMRFDVCLKLVRLRHRRRTVSLSPLQVLGCAGVDPGILAAEVISGPPGWVPLMGAISLPG